MLDLSTPKNEHQRRRWPDWWGDLGSTWGFWGEKNKKNKGKNNKQQKIMVGPLVIAPSQGCWSWLTTSANPS
jgi:hypothetical protein